MLLYIELQLNKYHYQWALVVYPKKNTKKKENFLVLLDEINMRSMKSLRPYLPQHQL